VAKILGTNKFIMSLYRVNQHDVYLQMYKAMLWSYNLLFISNEITDMKDKI
jgi:hypothetical protein